MREQSNESEEMYLESIYVLSQEKEKVRGADIARYLGNSRPTVSERLPKLVEQGLVKHPQSAPSVTLTKKGEDIARHIYERHRVLSQVFKALGVSPDTAVEDACRIEHYISDETFDAVKSYYEKSMKEDDSTEDD